MSQPIWRQIANLGDVNPIDYGGYFVYVDETGVYAPEAELLQAPDSDEGGEWIAYRFPLDRCTLTSGVMSDNPYHPLKSAWFAQPAQEKRDRPQDTTNLGSVARCCGVEESELITALCSADPIARAVAYQAIGDFHGFDNFDSYPRVFTSRADVESHYGIPTEEA